jgi:hypothetical protein
MGEPIAGLLTTIIYQVQRLFCLKLNVAIAFGTREMAGDE